MFPEPSRSFLVYVSGAITETKENPSITVNIRKLNRAALRMFCAGYSVYCPATTWFKDPGVYDDAWKQIMEMDFEIIKRCNGMYMVRGWESSRGAVMEHDFALELKLPIFYEGDPT